MQKQGWNIKDIYRNTTRDNMPADETITKFGDRLISIAQRMILENGGALFATDGAEVYRIRTQQPACIEPLVDQDEKFGYLRKRFAPHIRRLLDAEDDMALARAAYIAIALDLTEELTRSRPDRWRGATAALQKQTAFLKVLYTSSTPAAARLQTRMQAAGLNRP